MSRPSRVSVIVPVHNEELYIGRCLRSLLDQSLARRDYEIVVVNDGSTDRTSYAIGLFGADIRVLGHEEKKGLPAALNYAIRSSSAEFVVRVDADDYVNRNFLLFLQEMLIQNPYMDAVACDYWLCDDGENWLARGNCVAEPIACGIMFRRQQLLEVGLYDESFLRHEERELRVRFEQKYKVHRLELPLYRYRRHGRNITNDESAMRYHWDQLQRKHGGLTGSEG